MKIDRGIALGYRRNRGAGTWVVRVTRDGEDWTKRFGVADDYEEATAGHTLTYWTAQARARELAVGARETSVETDASKPATVATALDAYEADLEARGADPYNARRCRIHIPPGLAGKAVASLTAKELRHWRDGLLKSGLAAPSVKRTCRALKAALNLAASHDPRIANAAAWRTGLASLPDAESARNVILSEKSIRAIIRAAWDLDPELGLLAERAAVTGARASQLARLEVGDFESRSVGAWIIHADQQERPRPETYRALPGADSAVACGQAAQQPAG